LWQTSPTDAPEIYSLALIVLTTVSKSGKSPVSRFECTFCPSTLTSKTPPLDGISLSEPMRCLSSRSWTARPTAFGS